jgi:hypothetical protein
MIFRRRFRFLIFISKTTDWIVMKFFVEQDVVFLHLVKYFGKDSTNISRVILSGPYYPVAHFAPVSPNDQRVGCVNLIKHWNAIQLQSAGGERAHTKVEISFAAAHDLFSLWILWLLNSERTICQQYEDTCSLSAGLNVLAEGGGGGEVTAA